MTKIKQLHSRNAALIVSALLVLVIGFAAIVSADEREKRGERGERDVRDNRGPGNGMLNIAAGLNIFGPELKVQLENDGVRVHGATVSATSTSGLTATTVSPPLTFIVLTDASTKFNIKGVGTGSIANIAIGDTVNFRGVAVSGTTTSTWTIKATHVEDKTRHPATTSTASATSAAVQVRIDVLTRLITRLQAILDQLKVDFQLR